MVMVSDWNNMMKVLSPKPSWNFPPKPPLYHNGT